MPPLDLLRAKLWDHPLRPLVGCRMQTGQLGPFCDLRVPLVPLVSAARPHPRCREHPLAPLAPLVSTARTSAPRRLPVPRAHTLPGLGKSAIEQAKDRLLKKAQGVLRQTRVRPKRISCLHLEEVLP